MSFDFGQLLGPLGGMLAIAWGGGAVTGYAFASRTIGKRIEELKVDQKADQDKCDRAIADISSRLREIEDRYLHGMERQLSQVRQSSADVLGVRP